MYFWYFFKKLEQIEMHLGQVLIMSVMCNLIVVTWEQMQQLQLFGILSFGNITRFISPQRISAGLPLTQPWIFQSRIKLQSNSTTLLTLILPNSFWGSKSGFYFISVSGFFRSAGAQCYRLFDYISYFLIPPTPDEVWHRHLVLLKEAIFQN